MSEVARKTVLIPLADGSEELEFCSIADLLRRAELDVTVASVMETKVVECSRKVKVQADVLIDEVAQNEYDLIVLPGGGPGSKLLGASATLVKMLEKQKNSGKLYGAICAAPVEALLPNGLLGNSKATSFPSFHSKIPNQTSIAESVVVDGNLVTSQGVGTAFAFALKLIELLVGDTVAKSVADRALIPYP